MIADNTILPLAQRGLLHTSHLSIFDIAHIPQLFMNLISVSQLATHGYLVIFIHRLVMCRIVTWGLSLESVVTLVESFLDHLSFPHLSSTIAFVAYFYSISFPQWHHRLSHLCGSHLSSLIQ